VVPLTLVCENSSTLMARLFSSSCTPASCDSRGTQEWRVQPAKAATGALGSTARVQRLRADGSRRKLRSGQAILRRGAELDGSRASLNLRRTSRPMPRVLGARPVANMT
jgi:hypothetical protein